MGGEGRARAGGDALNPSPPPQAASGRPVAVMQALALDTAPQSSLSQSVLRGIGMLGEVNRLSVRKGFSGQITWGSLEFS